MNVVPVTSKFTVLLKQVFVVRRDLCQRHSEQHANAVYPGLSSWNYCVLADSYQSDSPDSDDYGRSASDGRYASHGDHRTDDTDRRERFRRTNIRRHYEHRRHDFQQWDHS